jgi:hypothetical protein
MSQYSLSIVERNISVTGELMRYLFENHQILQSLPGRFEVVILPEDDPEIRLYNLDLNEDVPFTAFMQSSYRSTVN